MDRTHGRTFRGSAAFFAMLLAASSGLAAETAGPDNAPADQIHPALPQAFGGNEHSLSTVSKFTRRRPPLARRTADTSPRGLTGP